MAALPPAPERLFDGAGELIAGNFAGPVADLNADDFDFRRVGRLPWTITGATASKLFKRWQFVGVIDEGLVVGAAVAHVQYLGNGFAYVYERPSGVVTERAIKAPLAVATRFSEAPLRGTTRMSLPGRRIEADNTRRTLEVDFGDALRVELNYEEPGQGVSTACPHATGGFHYTYKSTGLPARGAVVVQGRRYELSPNARALLDWTASTPPRKTIWNWACAVGATDAARPVGLNFSRGLVGGSYTQNAVWIDGVPHLVPPVNFAYDPQDVLGHVWRISTPDGALDLTFHPEEERYENIDLGLVASSLHQPFGRFEGHFKVGRKRVPLQAYGFCEEHYAKW